MLFVILTYQYTLLQIEGKGKADENDVDALEDVKDSTDEEKTTKNADKDSKVSNKDDKKDSKVSNKDDKTEVDDTDKGGEDEPDGQSPQIGEDGGEGEGSGVHEPDGSPTETKGTDSDDGGEAGESAGDTAKLPAKAPTESDYEQFAGGKIGLGFFVALVMVIVYYKCCRKTGGGTPAMSGYRSTHTKYQEV
jgi:hypothetical protein